MSSLFAKKVEPEKSVSLFGSAVSRKPVENGSVSIFSSRVVRKRIPVQLSDLDRCTGSLSDKKKAIDIILQTNVDNLKIDYVMSIGGVQQEAHKTIAEKCLMLSSHTLLKRCQDGVLTLIDLLEKTVHPSKAGFLAKLGGASEASFEQNLNQIKVLSKQLQSLGDALNDLLKECKEIYKEIDRLITDLAPFVISCEFFGEYTKEDFPSHLFLSRLTGLLTTINSARHNTLQVKTLEQSIIHLIDTIVHVVLTDLPQWLTHCTNDTQKQSILQKLKSK